MSEKQQVVDSLPSYSVGMLREVRALIAEHEAKYHGRAVEDRIAEASYQRLCKMLQDDANRVIGGRLV